MADLMYKSFTGSANVSTEDDCLHGKILFIDDIVTYEGITVKELKCAFEEAVDDYIAYCERTGKPPNKPYSGTFNVRIGSELHRKAVEAARKSNIGLNEYVIKSVQELVDRSSVTKIEHIHNHVVIVKDGVKQETRIATTTPPSEWEPVHATTKH